MNRRKFMMSSVMGAGALSLFPYSSLANNQSNLSSNLKRGLRNVQNVSSSNLPFEFTEAYKNLTIFLKEEGYTFQIDELIKLNENCYAIPLEKKSLLGFRDNDLGLIVRDKTTSHFYVVEEQVVEEFNKILESYEENMKAHGFKINTSDFVFPVEILSEKKGRESIFSYKNKLNNIITIKSSRKKTRALVH